MICIVNCGCGDVVCCLLCVFFFQAEDGIRDVAVTGVQTCALPICSCYTEEKEIAFLLKDNERLVKEVEAVSVIQKNKEEKKKKKKARRKKLEVRRDRKSVV